MAYAENRDMLHRVAAAALRPFGLESHAPDVVQEAVLSVWRHPPAQVSSWVALLVSTVKRRAIDVGKLGETRYAGPDVIELSERPAVAADVDVEGEFVAVEERELKVAAARAAISELPDDQRAVVRRMYYGEQSQAQIARELGLTPGRISQLKTTAYKKLATILEAKGVSL
ncbi:sigma-70 family RNA polymerase sigma factor [Nocardioides pantholopis]|uniref:sigma-70 family RNA polymerase sigma factor n=1 Tax=Nocardioides pantholopis TaxID=2483798 RepID=UPI0013DE1090|nr:sigma-70 family RNA polymerase sigma factor [Nocardioides pantholopis]